MRPSSLRVDVAGHALVLSNLRAAFDPALACLFVADAHFGKDAVFRARGVPVPLGANDDNLLRLDLLIAEHAPRTIAFLGDLLHARESMGARTLDALLAWRMRHAALRMLLIEGNHDRHAGALPVALGIETVSEPFLFGPWALCHYPQRVDDAYALAGHVHPVYRLATRNDSLRLPCFRFGRHGGVLPAFGAFTGGARDEVGAHQGEAIYLVTQDRVIPLDR